MKKYPKKKDTKDKAKVRTKDAKVKHPTIIQLRGKIDYSEILMIFERTCPEFYVEKVKRGYDVYVSDVNYARSAISKIQKIKKGKITTSTKYAGLRNGRVRVLFVYCLRF